MLKQLMLSRKIEQRQILLADLIKKEEDLQTRAEATEAAIAEAVTDEEMTAVGDEVEKLEAEKTELLTQKGKLETELKTLEAELDEIKSKAPETNPVASSGPADGQKDTERSDTGMLRGFFREAKMTIEQRDALLAREEVKDFLARARDLKGQQRGVTGGDLTIPTVMLDLLRDNLHRYSKLITKIRLKPVAGKSRQNICGAVPEGVWMETVGALNELEIAFNQIEVDGYKVGGYIPVPNPTLEDSDVNLASEILDMLGQAIGLAIDKAILYGSGVKMPVGIATRLAQTSAPDNWGADAPAWSDLHASNVKYFNPSGLTAEGFFAQLLLLLGIAKPNYAATGGTFWAMNRKTKMALLAKAITFNAAGALVSGISGTMPIEGGEIIELDFIPDNNIIGGFGSLYLLAERAGSSLAVSEHAMFIQDQTVFRGTARYDGEPVFGEGFVVVNIANSAPTMTRTFADDYANTDIGVLGVVSAASANANGDTVVTVSGTENSGTTLAYKITGRAVDVKNGSKPAGFTTWNGTDEITAATGKIITVIELNAAGRAIKVGSASVTAKSA